MNKKRGARELNPGPIGRKRTMAHSTLRPFTAQELKLRQIPKLEGANRQPVYNPTKNPPPPHTPHTPTIEHGRKFDQETYNQISGLDARFLELINFDAKMCQKFRVKGGRYTDKPEAYYAKILGVCRNTISDVVMKLEKLGILDVTRRRKIHGQWQTNIYRIKSWIWWRLGKMLRNLRKRPNRGTQTSHIANPMRENEDHKDIKGGSAELFTQQILARWKEKGIYLGQAVV